ETAEIVLCCAQFFAQQTDQLTALGTGNEAPFKEGRVRLVDRGGSISRADFGQACDFPAGDRRTHRERAARVAFRLHAEAIEDFRDVGGEIEISKHCVSPSGYRISSM